MIRRGIRRRHVFALTLCWTLVLGGGGYVLAAPDPAPADGGIPRDIPVIDVTGVKAVIPIAIPDFKDQSELPDSSDTGPKLAAILRGDLQYSGFFKVVDPKTYLVKSSDEGVTAATVRFKDWFNVGAQHLVKVGASVAGDRLRMEAHLFEVGSARAAWKAPIVFKGDLAEGRRLTHQLANAIIKHFTGEDGILTTRIAYSQSRRLGSAVAKNMMLVDYDGFSRRALTENAELNMFPRFSPSGGALYYSTSMNARWEIVRHALGGKQRVITSIAGRTALGAAPRPDGSGTLALSLSRDSNANIFLINKKGGVQRQLTSAWGINISPTWSPDGSQIAFVSDRSGSPQLYVMGADGSNPKRLTFRGNYNQEPDWSPKGKHIVFTARDERAKFDLFLVDVKDGLNMTRLTQDEGQHESARWSPDGRQIVFTSTRSGASKLYYMLTETRETRPVPSVPRGVYTPAWSPRPQAN